MSAAGHSLYIGKNQESIIAMGVLILGLYTISDAVVVRGHL